MGVFRSILASIDLTRGHDFGPSTPENPSKEAVRTALWLARKDSADLTFFSVLPGGGSTAAGQARTILSDLSRQAEASGLRARAEVVEGTPWVEINRQVEHGRHDLVVVGAPAAKGLVYALFGSTATKLLHKCPCPVWVAVPGRHREIRNLLIASDLSPVCENAVRLGTYMARHLGLWAHVLHVVDYPLDYHWSTGEADTLTAEYHQEVRVDALRDLREQLQRTGCLCGHQGVRLHVVGKTGIPDFDILDFVRQHEIDLLVAGMASREGIEGFLHGNTADRMLSVAPCPVLVVKPADLHYPQSEV
jgi:nucleotide-binding universal stress UspA family protein